MGDHVHNSLKQFFSLPLEKRTKKALSWLLERQWEKKNGKNGGFFSSEIEKEYKERALLMLSAFCQNEDVTICPLWASDQLLRAGVSEQLSFMGKIDRVDETPAGLHIIDYKTSKEEREDEWQLPMYAVLARRWFNKNVIKLSYLFLETGSWLSVPANPAREAWTIARIQQIVDSMPHTSDKNAWGCHLEADCHHCDYLRQFGLDPNGTEIVLPVINIADQVSS